MAWMTTRIRSRRSQKDAAGKETEQRFIYAGIMTYEKQGEKWVRVAMSLRSSLVSTLELPTSTLRCLTLTCLWV